MQNFDFGALERESLHEIVCARRRDMILERLIGRHNNKTEVA